MPPRLRGREHVVISGIAIREAGQLRSEIVRTTVRFAAATASQLERYVATGEWRGRAGAYAIQESGAWLVESIEGDYANVVGLPLAGLLRRRPDLLTGAMQGSRPQTPSVDSRSG